MKIANLTQQKSSARRHFSLKVASLCLLSILNLLVNISTTKAQNSIVTENGTTPNDQWPILLHNVPSHIDPHIEGFATDISYNRGEKAIFKIRTAASNYCVSIYRLGYYGGKGALYKANATIVATLPQSQPQCISDPATGLLDCGNWNISAEWQIPQNAVSGVYIAKLQRDGVNEFNEIVFVVRNDSSNSDIIFQTSDATWQAYNAYGNDNTIGRNLYPDAGGQARKVSYNRPFSTHGTANASHWIYGAEYAMLQWLEKNGFDVSYTTCIDTERRGALLTNHKAFLSVGHDEYWSKGMRDNVTNALTAGKSLAFFSGNEVYWKTRWESSTIAPASSPATSTPYRTLVCYKEVPLDEAGYSSYPSDPDAAWTGLWRNGCQNPTADACAPENNLTGQLSWKYGQHQLQVPERYRQLRFWRNVSQTDFQIPTNEILGYEIDPESRLYRDSYPSGRILLSETNIGVPSVGNVTHHLSLYKHSSGGWVFGAGTIQWAWGLHDYHEGGLYKEPSKAIRQATLNLLVDMGAVPYSPKDELIVSQASTDQTPPSITVTGPIAGTKLPSGTQVQVTGTATDNAAVAGVEVSIDGGTTWHLASGTNSWTYAWTPSQGQMTSEVEAVIKSRSFDDSGNKSQIISTTVTVTFPVGPCTVFQEDERPETQLAQDAGGLQLGMKFRSTVAGLITGVRFYKQPDNTGTHTGVLYSSNGNQLASVTFLNESPEGWQQAYFSNPVPIDPNTTYVISYHSPNGYYSYTRPGFKQLIRNGPLQALANGDAPGEANGVYSNASSPVFPASSVPNNATNYWVDAIFVPAPSYSIFTPSQYPLAPLAQDPGDLQLGMKFKTTVGGTITGVRFYKQPGNTGTHTGHLYSSNGNQLASVTFLNESPEGWQQAYFSSPVTIAANAIYTIAYYSPDGYYSYTRPGFNTNSANGNLTIRPLYDGEDNAGNGVYTTATPPSIPDNWVPGDATNYWVDVIFNRSDAVRSVLTNQPVLTSTPDLQLTVLPNPFSEHLTVTFTALHTSYSAVTMYNIHGTVVKSVFAGEAIGGKVKQLELKTNDLASGLYLMSLNSNGKTTYTKVLLVR